MLEHEGINRCVEACDLALRRSLEQLERFAFSAAREELGPAKDSILSAKSELDVTGEDQALDDLYLLKTYVGVFEDYCSYWELLAKDKHSQSWSSLQDIQDRLRIIYKFWPQGSRPYALEYVENQCVELEKLYPYKVFFSIGADVGEVECSICGKSMNSFECEHIAGELYRGRLAHGIARSPLSLDHVAMVTNPRDKRCVAVFDDNAEQFNLVRYLGALLKDRRMSPLQFSAVQFKKIEVSRTDLARVGRNSECPCGSGKKYKKCCLNSSSVLRDHADIIGTGRTINEVMPNNALQRIASPLRALATR